MQAPKPNPNETREHYCVRAHQALLKSLPDPDQRNKLVWDTWERYCGRSKAAQLAEKLFTPDKYVCRQGVAVFAEHATVNRDGRPVKYSAADLADIGRRMNFEAADLNHFAAVCDRHSPNDPDAKNEAVELGRCGNFRIGMIGREKPRFALFNDEYWRKDAAAEMSRRPSRSVELLNLPGRGRIVSPIVALGVEAARLPLPQQYGARRIDGNLVERYSAKAVATERYNAWACMPGAGSTHTPSPGGVKRNPLIATPKPPKARFAATADQPRRTKMNPTTPAAPTAAEPAQLQGKIDNDMVQAIIAAIANMPAMKWASEKMAAEQAASATPAPAAPDTAGPGAAAVGSTPPDAAAPVSPPVAEAATDEPAGPPEGGEDDLSDLLPEEPGGEPEPDGDEDEEGEEPKKYAALQSKVEQYGALAAGLLARQHQADEELATLREQYSAQASRLRDAERKAKIRELETEFPGIIPAEHYAAWTGASAIDDAAFEREVTLVRGMAEKQARSGVALMSMVAATGAAPTQNTGGGKWREAYSARHRQMVTLMTDRAYKGPRYSDDQLAEEVTKQLKAQGYDPAV